jgi:hypothetical protein
MLLALSQAGTKVERRCSPGLLPRGRTDLLLHRLASFKLGALT